MRTSSSWPRWVSRPRWVVVTGVVGLVVAAGACGPPSAPLDVQQATAMRAQTSQTTLPATHPGPRRHPVAPGRRARSVQQARVASASLTALTVAAATVASDLGSLHTASSSLSASEGFASELAGMDNSVQAAEQDLAVEQLNASTAGAEDECYDLPVDASTVAADDFDVRDDSLGVGGQVSSATTGMTEVSGIAAQLAADDAVFEADLAADPGGVSATFPGRDAVTAAEDRATGQVAGARVETTAAQAEDTADVNESASVLERAQALATACVDA